MKVKIISGCNEREVEQQVQQELDAALARGEKLFDVRYSTSAAVIADSIQAFDSPEEKSAIWHFVLLIFDTKN
jgi:hypothetical protein